MPAATDAQPFDDDGQNEHNDDENERDYPSYDVHQAIRLEDRLQHHVVFVQVLHVQIDQGGVLTGGLLHDHNNGLFHKDGDNVDRKVRVTFWSKIIIIPRSTVYLKM